MTQGAQIGIEEEGRGERGGWKSGGSCTAQLESFPFLRDIFSIAERTSNKILHHQSDVRVEQKNPAKFRDTCSVRANGLMGYALAT